jgi:hypothetical protein
MPQQPDTACTKRYFPNLIVEKICALRWFADETENQLHPLPTNK